MESRLVGLHGQAGFTELGKPFAHMLDVLCVSVAYNKHIVEVIEGEVTKEFAQWLNGEGVRRRWCVAEQEGMAKHSKMAAAKLNAVRYSLSFLYAYSLEGRSNVKFCEM